MRCWFLLPVSQPVVPRIRDSQDAIMPSLKQRTVHYKRAMLQSGAALDLQSLVKKAVAELKDVESREQPVVLGSSTLRVLSAPGEARGMWRARLMQYTKGQRQHFLQKDDATGDYILDTTEPPKDEKKKKREFVESILYLAIFKNHVCYVGSQALGSKHIEDHLNWLLRERGKIQSGDFLLLADQQSPAGIAKIRQHNVDRVEIGGDLELESVKEVKSQRKTKDEERVEGYKLVEPQGGMAEMLSNLLGPWFGDSPLKAALNRNEQIDVKLVLKYTNKKKTDEGFALMEKLAVAGRHFDKDQCKVHLHKAGTLVGSDLRLEHPVKVSITDSGLVEESTLYTDIHDWLHRCIAQKLVDS
jgi:hypothetical protein